MVHGPPRSSTPQSPPSHPPPAIEVMVVDDSAVVRQRLKSIIESDPHFRVVLAADPYEAVAILSKSVPGVIVLDVEMPRMDGLTFLRKLMRQHPMPVVLCTAQAERAVTALEMGAIEVIAKPNWQRCRRDCRNGRRTCSRASATPLGPGDCRCGTTGPRASDPRHTADVILPRVPYSPRVATTERIIVGGREHGRRTSNPQFWPDFRPESRDRDRPAHAGRFHSAFA